MKYAEIYIYTNIFRYVVSISNDAAGYAGRNIAMAAIASFVRSETGPRVFNIYFTFFLFRCILLLLLISTLKLTESKTITTRTKIRTIAIT